MKKNKALFSFFLGVLVAYIIMLIAVYMHEKRILENTDMKIIIPATYIEQEKETQTIKKVWKGTASYYSDQGCVGCRSDRLMANGERFDETAMTLAFNDAPLNTDVIVKNVNSGVTATAKITDTGGFNELGRIADLSKGLKEAIECADLCEVEIIKMYEK